MDGNMQISCSKKWMDGFFEFAEIKESVKLLKVEFSTEVKD